MEEELNKQFEFTELYYEFPKTIEVVMINASFNSTMHLYESPFANCQTFTIGGAFKLKYYNKEEVIELFKLIYIVITFSYNNFFDIQQYVKLV